MGWVCAWANTSSLVLELWWRVLAAVPNLSQNGFLSRIRSSAPSLRCSSLQSPNSCSRDPQEPCLEETTGAERPCFLKCSWTAVSVDLLWGAFYTIRTSFLVFRASPQPLEAYLNYAEFLALLDRRYGVSEIGNPQTFSILWRCSRWPWPTICFSSSHNTLCIAPIVSHEIFPCTRPMLALELAEGHSFSRGPEFLWRTRCRLDPNLFAFSIDMRNYIFNLMNLFKGIYNTI